MAQARNSQEIYKKHCHPRTRRHCQDEFRGQSVRWADCVEAECDRRSTRWVKKIGRVFTKAKRALFWKLIEPYFPQWPVYSSTNPTTDCIVGMTLHCFILSTFVLGVAMIKATLSFTKFLCYVALHYAVYKGDIIEPVTVDQLRDATIFDTSGLKIILIQNRSPRTFNNNRPTATPTRPRDSGSDSSQDLSNIFSSSSAS